MRMLYKCPGPHDLHGGKFDYVIVPEGDAEAKIAEGWFLTTPEAKAAHDAASAPAAELAHDAPATRAELEQKAAELGIKFDGRTSDKKLSAEIEAKLG